MLVFNKTDKKKYILLQNLKKEEKSKLVYPIVPSTKRKYTYHNWMIKNENVINDMVEYICQKLYDININLKESLSGYTIYINKINLFKDLSFYVYNQSSNKYNI